MHFNTDKEGKSLSPVLAESIINYLIDIDGTICEDIPNEEPERMKSANLYDGATQYVNNLYDAGHIVTFFTSRTVDLKEITEIWLTENGFKYHSVLYGKPRGGNYHWIDNHPVKTTHFKGKFSTLIGKIGESEKFEE
ncbi:MAG: phosphoheptose isomerase [Saprospiraceae bacterium]|nr:phosphoheptose isomerase [Saprospiraceae bacterium]